jgi:hypothetical protein
MDGTRTIVHTKSVTPREEFQNVSIEINRHGVGRVINHSELFLYHTRRVDGVTVFLGSRDFGTGVTESMVKDELARLHQCLPEDIELKPYVSISRGINT